MLIPEFKYKLISRLKNGVNQTFYFYFNINRALIIDLLADRSYKLNEKQPKAFIINTN